MKAWVKRSEKKKRRRARIFQERLDKRERARAREALIASVIRDLCPQPEASLTARQHAKIFSFGLPQGMLQRVPVPKSDHGTAFRYMYDASEKWPESALEYAQADAEFCFTGNKTVFVETDYADLELRTLATTIFDHKTT